MPVRSWAMGDDHGSVSCGAGADGTFSHAERLECAKGGGVAIFNDARSGAKIGDFHAQASAIRGRLAAEPGPRYVPVLLGHNDACTNELARTGNACGGDRDPNNYCRTTPAAFEREFRRGMDELIQLPGARVAVIALIRISQLCHLGETRACGPLFALRCREVWRISGLLEDIFGDGGVCASLTSDCSSQRRVDMYETLAAYNEVLARVTAEYAALSAGAASPTGATKADDVAIVHVEGSFHYRFTEGDVSCCDCFHPSEAGQGKLAEFTWNGMTCTPEAPCCATTGDPLVDADCSAADTTARHRGGFWAGGVVCGNGVVDPGESCDDGNDASGDGCSSTCDVEPPSPSPTPTATPVPVSSPTPTASAAFCAGDCDGAGGVGAEEIARAVEVALARHGLDDCRAADRDRDLRVTVDEVVAAAAARATDCRSS